MRTRLLALTISILAIAGSQVAGGAAARRPSAPSPTPAFSSTRLGGGGGEPNIAISPNGRTILATGLGSANPANFFRSTDAGRTFKEITPTFEKKGGGDWDMRWLDDRTLVAADLSLGRDGIIIDRSVDAGLTWTSTTIHMDVYDRPWIDHFGTDKVYVTAKGFDGVPYLYSSTDGGRTFGEPLPVPILVYGTGLLPAAAGGDSPTPVEALVTNQDAYVDHLTVDPKSGDVYILYGIGGENSYSSNPPTGISNRLYVAHLESGKMVSHAVHLGGSDEGYIAGFNWMSVDARGTLYVLANGVRGGHYSTFLSFSKDKGTTWSPLADVGVRGQGSNVYGSIASGAPGTLSLVYLHGTNADPSKDQMWYATMARISAADTAKPKVYTVRANPKPVHTKDICFDGILCGTPGFGSNRDLLDYIWNAVGPDGTAYAVVASDGPATGDADGHVSVLLLKQTAGVKHGRGVQS